MFGVKSGKYFKQRKNSKYYALVLFYKLNSYENSIDDNYIKNLITNNLNSVVIKIPWEEFLKYNSDLLGIKPSDILQIGFGNCEIVDRSKFKTLKEIIEENNYMNKHIKYINDTESIQNKKPNLTHSKEIKKWKYDHKYVPYDVSKSQSFNSQPDAYKIGSNHNHKTDILCINSTEIFRNKICKNSILETLLQNNNENEKETFNDGSKTESLIEKHNINQFIKHVLIKNIYTENENLKDLELKKDSIKYKISDMSKFVLVSQMEKNSSKTDLVKNRNNNSLILNCFHRNADEDNSQPKNTTIPAISNFSVKNSYTSNEQNILNKIENKKTDILNNTNYDENTKLNTEFNKSKFNLISKRKLIDHSYSKPHSISLIRPKLKEIQSFDRTESSTKNRGFLNSYGKSSFPSHTFLKEVLQKPHILSCPIFLKNEQKIDFLGIPIHSFDSQITNTLSESHIRTLYSESIWKRTKIGMVVKTKKL